jgi:hypothetical protein
MLSTISPSHDLSNIKKVLSVKKHIIPCNANCNEKTDTMMLNIFGGILLNSPFVKSMRVDAIWDAAKSVLIVAMKNAPRVGQ